MTVAIAIVAHTKRAEQAHQLMDTVGAQYLSMDDGTLGCTANHIRCWTYLAKQPTEWSLVLEDDAQPIHGFRDQLDLALDAAPTEVVSLYLGRERPVWMEFGGRGSAQRVQPVIIKALARADEQGASFITAPKLLHAVAVAVRTNLIDSMLKHVQESKQPIDFAIGDWCTANHHQVAYTYPSLCDHEDGPTVIRRHPDGEPRHQPRKAHKVGTADAWTKRSVTLQ